MPKDTPEQLFAWLVKIGEHLIAGDMSGRFKRGDGGAGAGELAGDSAWRSRRRAGGPCRSSHRAR